MPIDGSLITYCHFRSLAGLQCGGVYLSIGFQMKNIKKLYNELQTIVDNGMQLIFAFKWFVEKLFQQDFVYID